MKILNRLLVAFAICFCGTSQLYAYDLSSTHFVTEDLAPYSFVERGRLTGLSVELLRAALSEAGVPTQSHKITMMPWARAYNLALTKPNYCLFSALRTVSREAHFKWVGPIAQFTSGLMARKGTLQVSSARELMHYAIGAVRNSSGHYLLRSIEYPEERIDLSVDFISLVNKLAHDRVDAAAFSDTVARYFMKSNRINPDDYELAYVFLTGDVYFAFNKNASDETVSALQQAIDKLRADGTLQQIVNKYL